MEGLHGKVSTDSISAVSIIRTICKFIYLGAVDIKKSNNCKVDGKSWKKLKVEKPENTFSIDSFQGHSQDSLEGGGAFSQGCTKLKDLYLFCRKSEED